MTHRSLVSMGKLAALLAVLAWVATATVAGQGPSAAKTNASYTPLQRPKNVTKEFYTPAELEELAAAVLRENARDTGTGTPRDLHYDNTQFGIDKGQATYAQNLRTSLIVDPPDGRIPSQIPEAVKR